MGVHPFSELECRDEIVSICTGQVSSDKDNVDQCISIGKDQVNSFYESLPNGFYEPPSKKVVTMAAGKNNVKVGDVNVLDTTLICSSVMALRMTSTIIEVKVLFSYVLAPLPTSKLDEFGEIYVDKSKAKLRKLLAKEVSAPNISKSDLVALDGCAILWSVNWLSNGKVSDFVDNCLSYVFTLLHESDDHLVFDRYYKYSIKSVTHSERAKSANVAYVLNLESPLPTKSIILKSAKNEVQLINIICQKSADPSWSKDFPNALAVTDQSSTPFKVYKGKMEQQIRITSTPEEADVIMVNQAYDAVLQNGVGRVHVVCDDTDVFALLTFFFCKLNITEDIKMLPTDSSCNAVDIYKTVESNIDLIPSLLASCALSECDTTARYYDIAKGIVVKQLKKGLQLLQLGDTESDSTDTLQECSEFISSCYGSPKQM